MAESEVIQDRRTALEMLQAAAGMKPPAAGKITKTPNRHIPVRVYARRRTCRCGLCRACRENARWERVYNEKYADAGYYIGLRLSCRSPLDDL